MAKKTTVLTNSKTVQQIKYITCDGCQHLELYDNFPIHGFCGHMGVKMTVVINSPKKCIWRENG